MTGSKNIILSLNGCSGKTYQASAKIANFLSEILGLEIIDDAEKCRSTIQQGEVHTVFFINSISAFCKHINEAADIVSKCKRFIYVQNDYTIEPPTQVRNVMRPRGKELEVLRWSTVPMLPERYKNLVAWNVLPLEATYINWNMLTYKPIYPKKPVIDRVLYYGAFRKDRVRLFDKYLDSDQYEVSLSSSSKGIKKFIDAYPMIFEYKIQDDLIEFISKFKATLYLEDAKSNDIYCSPANRFYECLAAGTPMLFDESSVNTMERAGYDILRYVVNSEDDVVDSMNWIEEIQRLQAVSWRRDYYAELVHSVRREYAKL